jgi:hypothetical protein
MVKIVLLYSSQKLSFFSSVTFAACVVVFWLVWICFMHGIYIDKASNDIRDIHADIKPK